MFTKLAGLKTLTLLACVGFVAACSKPKEAPPPPPPPPAEQAPTVERDTIEQREVLPPAGSIADLVRVVGTDRVFFAFDSAELSPQARETLRKGAEWLRANASVALMIEGHADERGTREYNLALGERRANAVRSYLMALGVAGNRLQTISYGKERPDDPRSTEEAWAKNRRAVATIASGGAVN
ncbi:MAG: peptidoglycan-associated lipoprotein Pal [Pseudomonadota bacterium]